MSNAWPAARRPAILADWEIEWGSSPPDVAAAIAELIARWCFADDVWAGSGVTLTIDRTDKGSGMQPSTVAFTLDRDGRRSSGMLVLTPRDDGWVEAEVTIAGTSWLTARCELVYEEVELWPPGSEGVGEAPGRIGKHGTWAQIDSGRWPQIDGGDERWPAIELVEP